MLNKLLSLITLTLVFIGLSVVKKIDNSFKLALCYIKSVGLNSGAINLAAVLLYKPIAKKFRKDIYV